MDEPRWGGASKDSGLQKSIFWQVDVCSMNSIVMLDNRPKTSH